MMSGMGTDLPAASSEACMAAPGATTVEDMQVFHWLEADSSAIIDTAQTSRVGNLSYRRQASTTNFLKLTGARRGMATLRFRPLSGERRQITELNYDARKLGMQVERLSAVLDSAPLPIWLRNAEGKLSWVNQAYVKAVELPDSNAVLKSLIEVAAPDRIDTTKADPKVGLLGRPIRF